MSEFRDSRRRFASLLVGAFPRFSVTLAAHRVALATAPGFALYSTSLTMERVYLFTARGRG